MTDYGTIKIPEPAYDHHNQRRQELGLTWEQYINGQEPDTPDGVGDLAERLDTIEDAAKEAADAAQSADRKVEELQR